jgi:amino acid permease-like protein
VTTAPRRNGRFLTWLYLGLEEPTGPHGKGQSTAPWWQVMCLTGVDYFSTLGYQPGIAFLAAGFLSPIATLILVLVTLFGALPAYARIARLSPHGQGSISVLEEKLPRWRGKAMVLCLLGFAATGFVITITLSAADATAHVTENPFFREWASHRVALTLALISALGAIFLKGVREAVWLAVTIVAVYLALNLVVVVNGLVYIAGHPQTWSYWAHGVLNERPNYLMALVAALLVFPRLALGLSGFETGVAVMPLVRGEGETDEERLASRIRNSQKLLALAAAIMSLMLVGSSVVTTILIPPAAFESGGEANGRALAYIAHRDLGNLFGTLYDISTITILWFAGASAMAGLLNLIPRYLPRYGMAPEWARASRPVVLIITAIGFLVTFVFDADVDNQAGAYATGVLVLMTSVAFAATISTPGRRTYFGAVFAVFLYTTIVNIVERPEGLKIATWFIVAIVSSSLVSRVMRSTELRAHGVQYNDVARKFLDAAAGQPLRIIANRPDSGLPEEYASKLREAREAHHLPPDARVMFLEVHPGDSSAFSESLRIEARDVGGHQVLSTSSPAIPNAIAAVLLDLRDQTGVTPHAYFGWTEGNPITYLLRFLAFGEGDTAPVTREVLRQAEPRPERRPRIHVG